MTDNGRDFQGGFYCENVKKFVYFRAYEFRSTKYKVQSTVSESRPWLNLVPARPNESVVRAGSSGDVYSLRLKRQER